MSNSGLPSANNMPSLQQITDIEPVKSRL